MKVLTITLVAVIMLSVASVAATNQSKATLGERVSALEKQVAQLQTFRWTEQHARNVVSQRVWDRLTSCRIPKQIGACTDLDPVVYAFRDPAVPDAVSHRLYREGIWSAQPGADGDSWQVSVTITTEDGHTWGPFTWYVWSSNSLVWSASYYSDQGYGKR